MDEHIVIKTLVMEDERGIPLIILMNGDRQVSTKALARILGVKSITPAIPGSRKNIPAIGWEARLLSAQRSLSGFSWRRGSPNLPRILINAGSRGLLAEMPPAELIRILKPSTVKVAI